MATKVVDASALAAIVFNEPNRSAAEAQLAGVRIAAPTLLAYELTNIARTKSVSYPERPGAFESILAKALSMDIQWMSVDHCAVLRLSLDTGLSTYDASYLHLARSLGVPLVTFDHQLQSVLQARGD